MLSHKKSLTKNEHVISIHAAINSFTTVAVTFLTELGFTGTLSGLVFLEVLICTIPGSMFASYFMKKTCPLVCMKINLIIFIAINFVAFLLLSNQAYKNTVWIFGALWGFMLGM